MSYVLATGKFWSFPRFYT